MLSAPLANGGTETLETQYLVSGQAVEGGRLASEQSSDKAANLAVFAGLWAGPALPCLHMEAAGAGGRGQGWAAPSQLPSFTADPVSPRPQSQST